MISIIIPTYNSAQNLPFCFQPLVEGMVEGLVKEVLVVDGGSDDETVQIANEAGAEVIRTEKGRGVQLRAGGQRAKGDWLLFLHSDTVLEEGWWQKVRAFIHHAGPPAACFQFCLDDKGVRPSLVAKGVNMRTRMFKLPYGDQGLLIKRDFYHQKGGFAPVRLMEDVDFIKRLKRRELACLPIKAITSSSKYRRDGYGRRILRNQYCYWSYKLGAGQDRLLKIYEKNS